MPKLVDRLHVGRDIVGVGRFCRNRCQRFVEVEVGSCGPGNEPCPAIEGQILDCPVHKNQNAQWRPIRMQSESEISDNVDIWVIGNGEPGTGDSCSDRSALRRQAPTSAPALRIDRQIRLPR